MSVTECRKRRPFCNVKLLDGASEAQGKQECEDDVEKRSSPAKPKVAYFEASSVDGAIWVDGHAIS